jgi:hypothetical protein
MKTTGECCPSSGGFMTENQEILSTPLMQRVSSRIRRPSQSLDPPRPLYKRF